MQKQDEANEENFQFRKTAAYLVFPKTKGILRPQIHGAPGVYHPEIP
jgi:hypothetical protein